MTAFQKYRTFFIIGTAEGLGLILTKPKDLSLFFLTWTLLILIMLFYSFLEWRFGKPKTGDTLPAEDGTPKLPVTRNLADLDTIKNRNYSLILLANLLVYLSLSLFL